MINPQDIILYQGITCDDNLLEQIKEIANHTKNTWQTNRMLNEIISDTTIGKVAEHTLKNHIKQHSNYFILDYDDFRKDNYKKHAPLDCIILQKDNNNLQNAINQINLDAANNPNGALSQNTKEYLKKLQIFTMEIKSTRITNRHKDEKLKISYEKILKDDFLTYPKFFRKIPNNVQVNGWEDYYRYCIDSNKIQPEINLILLKNIELENMYDYYARVYVEQININLFNVYIIGYIIKQNFINNSNIKRMPQYNKSEQALYIATKLKNGIKFK
ncbi:MAG: hypothetical protein J1E31_02105 [Helicobacter sp.]|nr:hypothetical protein [Helicobacter sp.]